MSEIRRNYLRFNPESLDIAIAGLDDSGFSNYDTDTDQFNGDMAGLIIDQSFKGCSVVFINREKSDAFLPEGLKCIVKVGKMSPLPALVRWREDLPSNLVKVGFEFLK